MIDQLEQDLIIASEFGLAVAEGEDFTPSPEQLADAETLRDMDEEQETEMDPDVLREAERVCVERY